MVNNDCFESNHSVTMTAMTDRSYADVPLIIAFVSDIMIETRISSAATHLGLRLQTINLEELERPDNGRQPERKPGEPIFGPEAALVDRLTAQRPALLIFNLGNDGIPWERWISLLKSSPATRRIPIVCFGPHVDRASLQRATDLGAEVVVPRSRFMSTLQDLLQENILLHDMSAIADSCLEPLSHEALLGLEEFNKGNYFESHEHLEDAWNLDESEAKELYRAVLQIAVAYLQINRANYRGAVKMFLRARQWLAPLPSSCRGIDIEQLRSDAESVYQEIVALGPEKISTFDKTLFRPVRYDQR